jgi:hypothetical protein
MGVARRLTSALVPVIAEVYSEHEDEIAAAATEMKPCDYCEIQHYEEFTSGN